MYLVLGLGLLSRISFAQDLEMPVAPLPPGMKAAIGRLKVDVLSPQPARKGSLVTVCSVPLIVVRPPDPEPNGMSVPLPKANIDNMPAVTLPAPPCKELLSAAAQ